MSDFIFFEKEGKLIAVVKKSAFRIATNDGAVTFVEYKGQVQTASPYGHCPTASFQQNQADFAKIKTQLQEGN